ncbi:FdtA/QdtA family cupin domain-containing protein [Sulfurovum sp. AR]|uniref:sugar 3,4-ketoisomerase n=1 Tax=Sulfurovum sp. AR TaxID=1165841 RepID=UPI00025C4BB7|nr:FdtA/QdtA family cupin domain-containing protein [Sulfurovum sp. AR]EIF51002.1 WxcM domain-containing protein [Sulfurovum sp. AR]
MSNYELINFKTLGDERGSLIAIEEGYNAPFDIKRVYYIFDTKEGVIRGYHAHINLKQIAIVVKGSCTFILDNGKQREEITLNSPNKGLLIEGLIWREMYDFSDDCVLVVIANELYDESDYIRDYQSFISKVNNAKN